MLLRERYWPQQYYLVGGFAECYFVSFPLPPSPSPTPYDLANENYRTAVTTLVNQLGLTAINVHLGNLTPAFGWTSFALALLCNRSRCCGGTEYTLDKTYEKIMRKAEEEVSRGTGRRISSVEAREWKNAVTSANERGSSAGRDS